MTRSNELTIMLTGGGTAGSVTPLLAVANELASTHSDIHFTFVGTKQGIERSMVEQSDLSSIRYIAIPAGKLRRYASWKNITDLFVIAWAKVVSFVVLIKNRPHIILSAGSFVSVPVVWVAWVLNIPVVVHQQDLKIGLANKLMAPFATKLTQAFAVSKFRGAKTVGNPVRELTPTTDTIQLDHNYPTVLIMGGSTGAAGINALVTTDLCEQANVVHITGPGKGGTTEMITHERYQAYEVLHEEIKEALHKADVVVSRAGLGAISELAALGKPTIIIPMPYSHQEDNADFISEANAAVVLDETRLTPQQLTNRVVTLLNNPVQQATLSENIKEINSGNAAENLAKLIINSI